MDRQFNSSNGLRKQNAGENDVFNVWLYDDQEEHKQQTMSEHNKNRSSNPEPHVVLSEQDRHHYQKQYSDKIMPSNGHHAANAF